MSYTLSGITLPKPKQFTRRFIEKGAEHLLMFGKTTKRIENRKEQFTLVYQYLPQSTLNSILSQYELNSVLSFTVNEVALEIPRTDVLMDVADLKYPPTAEEYRENVTLVLTEVL